MKAKDRRYRIRGGGVFLSLLSVGLISVGFGAYFVSGGVSDKAEASVDAAVAATFISLDVTKENPDGFDVFSYSDDAFLSNGKFVEEGILRYYLRFDSWLELAEGDEVSFLLRLDGITLSTTDVLDRVALNAGGTFANSIEEGSIRSVWTSPGSIASRSIQLIYVFNSSLLPLLPNTGVSFYLEADLL